MNSTLHYVFGFLRGRSGGSHGSETCAQVSNLIEIDSEIENSIKFNKQNCLDLQELEPGALSGDVALDILLQTVLVCMRPGGIVSVLLPRQRKGRAHAKF